MTDFEYVAVGGIHTPMVIISFVGFNTKNKYFPAPESDKKSDKIVLLLLRSCTTTNAEEEELVLKNFTEVTPVKPISVIQV